MPKRKPPDSDLLPLSEAATFAGLSHNTLRAQIRNGSLEAVKFGRSWAVTRAELKRYMRENKRGTPP